MPDRLTAQIAFLKEIDKLKHVLRRSILMDGSRRENSAEHSWHVAAMVWLLAEHAAEQETLDVGRVVRMALVHDLVEIDAGDTFVYDAAARDAQTEAERAAAERIFGLLPADQAAEMRDLWEEYERRQTPEARFAYAVDRFLPLMHSYATRGTVWREHGITSRRVLEENRAIADGSPTLWEWVETMVREAVEEGWLAP